MPPSPRTQVQGTGTRIATEQPHPPQGLPDLLEPDVLARDIHRSLRGPSGCCCFFRDVQSEHESPDTHPGFLGFEEVCSSLVSPPILRSEPSSNDSHPQEGVLQKHNPGKHSLQLPSSELSTLTQPCSLYETSWTPTWSSPLYPAHGSTKWQPRLPGSPHHPSSPFSQHLKVVLLDVLLSAPSPS